MPGSRANWAGPYQLEVSSYWHGATGYDAGKLEIIEHDGQGGLLFDERPFVIAIDGATLSLGSYPPSEPLP